MKVGRHSHRFGLLYTFNSLDDIEPSSSTSKVSNASVNSAGCEHLENLWGFLLALNTEYCAEGGEEEEHRVDLIRQDYMKSKRF